MRISHLFFGVVAAAAFSTPTWAASTSCTAQAELSPRDRDALAAVALSTTQAIATQDYATLKTALLPAVAADWENIREAVEQTGSLLKGGQIQLRSAYLLDATSLSAPADTQFFCGNQTGTLTVTLSMRALPPGRYAVVLAESAGSPFLGQIALILAADANQWKLGGLSIRPGQIDGHDGRWYWTRARDLALNTAKNDPWSAYLSYELARILLVPVDFLSSPNLDRLNQEQSAIRNSPQEAFPYTLQDGARSWKIEAVHADPSMLHADLAVIYDPTGVTDPAAQRTEATAVLSALLKAQPGLRAAFHGMSAYALKDGKPAPILDLPMNQIP